MPAEGAAPAPALIVGTLFVRMPTGWAAALSAGALVLAGGCAPTPTQPPPTASAASAPATGTTAAAPVDRPPPPPSAATTARAYRKDAASHVYALNADRVYAGKLPPMLYAVGVLEVDVDRKGNVVGLHWLRAPRHAPEVVTEIERTARAAAPYPVPERLGKVTYTDTWLWDKSGRFQLDTLTEGQN
ncbi:MAG: hypothetical protein IAE92_01940 [Burkholderiaceae bacterium]|nr:hypothetical protein [Burkholderiaceae bacterium]